MSSLKTKLQEDLKEALKKGDAERVLVLRQVFSAIVNTEKEKRARVYRKEPQLTEEDLEKKSLLTDEEIIEVLSLEAKKRREAITEFERGQRLDLSEKEKRELEIIQEYLPPQLSEEEIKKLAKEIIYNIGAKDLRDIGKVMAELMPKVKGRTEGSVVNKIVRELLTAS